MRVKNNFKDDSAIASRYLADQLTADEREEFETHGCAAPKLRRSSRLRRA